MNWHTDAFKNCIFIKREVGVQESGWKMLIWRVGEDENENGKWNLIAFNWLESDADKCDGMCLFMPGGVKRNTANGCLALPNGPELIWRYTIHK